MIKIKDVYMKAKMAVGRKLQKHEYIQLARLSKQYGMQSVYDAFNFIDCSDGWFYSQLLKYLNENLKLDIEEIDIDSIIGSKEDRNSQ